MVSGRGKCQEDSWAGAIIESDWHGERKERSSDGTRKPFANELTFKLRFKEWKGVSQANLHYKLREVLVQRP